MTDFIATGDCNDNVTLTQTKGSSFAVNTYVATNATPPEEFASGDTVHITHGTPTVHIHAEYRDIAGGPVLYSQEFDRPITWAENCSTVPPTTAPPAQTTTTKPVVITTTTTVPHTSTTPPPVVTTTATTAPPSQSTLPATGGASDALVGGGLVLLVTGILAVIGGTFRRVHR